MDSGTGRSKVVGEGAGTQAAGTRMASRVAGALSGSRALDIFRCARVSLRARTEWSTYVLGFIEGTCVASEGMESAFSLSLWAARRSV